MDTEPCQEKVRLLAEYNEAVKAHSEVVRHFRDAAAMVVSRTEFASINHGIDESRDRVEKTRQDYEKHCWEHNCLPLYFE